MNINKSQVLNICKKLKIDLISYELLGLGAHHLNYVLNTTQGKLVLRIDNSAQWHHLKNEYAILKKLDGKFGPKVFLLDTSRKIIPADFLIEEFIEGQHPTQFPDDFITTMAKWYKRLHKHKTKKLPVYIKKSDYYSLWESYWHHCSKDYEKFKHVASKTVRKQIDPIYDKTTELMKKNEKVFKKRQTFSLIQGDPTRRNVFYKKGGVQLIDWQFAKYNLEEWDLTFFVWCYDLNEKKKNLFLKTYGYAKSRKKQFDIIQLLNGLSMLSWRLERWDLVNKKKLDKRHIVATKKDILHGLNEDIPKVKRLLEQFYS